MASVPAARVPALAAEVEQVLAWAHRRFKGRRGPIEEGGDWDYDLQGLQEGACALHLDYVPGDGAASQLLAHGSPELPARYTVSLALSGGAAFGEALRQRFALD